MGGGVVHKSEALLIEVISYKHVVYHFCRNSLLNLELTEEQLVCEAMKNWSGYTLESTFAFQRGVTFHPNTLI